MPAGMNPDDRIARRAAQLEWLLCDVDGVLTDGRIFLDGQGELVKAFHVRDGLGIKMARGAGLKVGLLSARSSPALKRRAAQLDLDAVMTGREDKAAAFAEFLSAQGTSASRVGYIGDDLNDLAVLARCGLSLAPSDAAAELHDVVDVVLVCRGGRGVVREAVELILRARGDWKNALAVFSLES